MAELLPPRHRSVGMSLASAAGGLCGFLNTWSLTGFIEAVGGSVNAFLCYGTLNAIGAGFIAAFVPSHM